MQSPETEIMQIHWNRSGKICEITSGETYFWRVLVIWNLCAPLEKENNKLSKIPGNNPETIVQVSILLPTHEHKYPEVKLEPAQNKSGPGILAGFQSARDLGQLPNNVIFNVTFRDSRCDNTYAPKSFTDAILDGVDVLFGPSCEYALGKQFSYHSSFDPKIQWAVQ